MVSLRTFQTWNFHLNGLVIELTLDDMIVCPWSPLVIGPEGVVSVEVSLLEQWVLVPFVQSHKFYETFVIL